MPELAEVETVRRHIQTVLKGKKIKDTVADPKDRWLFAFVSYAQVHKTLKGAKITGTGRKGKYFWIELNRKPWPLFHLGMSGNISILSKKIKHHQKIWGGAELWSEGKQGVEKRLWFSRLLIEFSDGFEMAFIDPRRFGRMWLTDDPWTHSRIKKLGYDPLIDFPPVAVLKQKLSRRNKKIKTVLLDQSFFAGIGNWLADEILFQAGISPHRRASELSLKEIQKLRLNCLKVVKKAVVLKADYSKFPKTWLFHDRWGKVKNSKTHRGQILHDEIDGRTAAWVPNWQK